MRLHVRRADLILFKIKIYGCIMTFKCQKFSFFRATAISDACAYKHMRNEQLQHLSMINMLYIRWFFQHFSNVSNVYYTCIQFFAACLFFLFDVLMFWCFDVLSSFSVRLTFYPTFLLFDCSSVSSEDDLYIILRYHRISEFRHMAYFTYAWIVFADESSKVYYHKIIFRMLKGVQLVFILFVSTLKWEKLIFTGRKCKGTHFNLISAF